VLFVTAVRTSDPVASSDEASSDWFPEICRMYQVKEKCIHILAEKHLLKRPLGKLYTITLIIQITMK
jgi:hypothetical protein